MSRKSTIMVSRSVKTIAVMTLFGSLVWTAYGIYSVVREPIDLEIEPSYLAPVNPNIDKETLSKLQARRQLSTENGSEEVIKKAIEIMQIEAASLTPNQAPSPEPVAEEEPALITEPTSDELPQASPEPSL